MDYEKKYNDALKRAKAVMDVAANRDEARGIATTIFPELRESEDEKMMNQLHSWMMEFGGAEEYTEKVYQWLKELLEKQKESLHISEKCKENVNSFTDESEDERIRKALVDGMRQIRCKNGITQEQMIAYLKKQKEQKPEEHPVKEDEYWHGFNEGKGTVLDNPGEYGLYKSAEWSEEDEKKITFLVNLMKYNIPEGTFKKSDGCKDRFVTKSEAIDMLKSLRPQPHWKPCGQQLDCLRYMINVSTVGKIDKQLVQDLYEQLQKLM